jgi:DNA-binding response OmpR family regulator
MREKILVVDDEKLICKMLSQRLAMRGFDVMTAKDACEFYFAGFSKEKNN